MIWGKTNKQQEAKTKRREGWHLWFAWRPVIIDTGRVVWLETVRRQSEFHAGYAGSGWDSVYKRKNKE